MARDVSVNQREVSMKYYALSQKKAPGCPIGMLGGALYDKYYPDVKAIEVGYFPWYANPSRGKAHEKFPPGLVFISKDGGYNFDIRGDLNFYYIISDKFKSLISRFEVEAVDVTPISICSQAGEKISEKHYYAAVFQSFSPEMVSDDGESQFVRGKFGGISRIKRLVVREDFSCHIFKLNDMEGSSNTLICSEQFRDAAMEIGIEGVDFLDAAAIDWPTVKPI